MVATSFYCLIIVMYGNVDNPIFCIMLMIFIEVLKGIHVPLVLSGPAGPNWHRSGINRVLYPIVTGRFVKRPSCGQSSHRCSHLGIALHLLVILDMRSFLIIVVKLYSYKDSDVGNLQTFKYFRDYVVFFITREIRFN